MRKAQFYYRDSGAPSPNHPPGLGVVAIIVRQGGVLLERRTDSDRWAFIGGGMQAKESLLEALYREVREETGLVVARARLFGTFSDPSRIAAFPDGNIKRIISIAFRVDVEAGQSLVCSEESRELRYIPYDELADIPLAETHFPIRQALLDNREIVLE